MATKKEFCPFCGGVRGESHHPFCGLAQIDHNHGDDDQWCETCHNTGSINCYCGGDLCICENHGEMPCPSCRDV